MTHEKTIGITGSIFLILLGVFNFFFKKVPKHGDVRQSYHRVSQARYGGMVLFSGFFMNLLNPAVSLFWFAASATILEDSETAEAPEQYRFIVFATCLLFVLAADLSKVMLAGKIRTKLTPAQHSYHRSHLGNHPHDFWTCAHVRYFCRTHDRQANQLILHFMAFKAKNRIQTRPYLALVQAHFLIYVSVFFYLYPAL